MKTILIILGIIVGVATLTTVIGIAAAVLIRLNEEDETEQ